MQLFGFYQFFYDLFNRLKYRVYIMHTQSEIGTADGYKKYNNIYCTVFNDCRIRMAHEKQDYMQHSIKNQKPKLNLSFWNGTFV